eukprot:c23964_g1_i1 orf=334-2559(-)
MKPYRLLPAVFGLLLSLPFCLSAKPGSPFFSTHSSRPWSHHQPWHLRAQTDTAPAVAMEGSSKGVTVLNSPKSACDTMSGSPDMLNPNHISVNSTMGSLNPQERHAESRKFKGYNNRTLGKTLTKKISEDDLTGYGNEGGGSEGENKDVSCHKLQAKGMVMSGLVGVEGKQAVRTVGLIVWLAVLFYLLGTTASDYFSCTLEKLSDVLNLSPAVAGVTLLAIGNGAPDVFSSVMAFASSDRTGNIGFGSVLGGALFITTIVSGTVALVTCRGSKEPSFGVFRRNETCSCKIPSKDGCPVMTNDGSVSVHMKNGISGAGIEEGPGSTAVSSMHVTVKEACVVAEGSVRVDMVGFMRDVFFLLFSVGVLTLVLLDGKVQLWEAIAFLCIYPLYASVVWITEVLQRSRRSQRSSLLDPLLPKATIENSVPQWTDMYQTQECRSQWVDVYETQAHPHYHVHSQDLEAEVERRWEDPSNHSLGAKLKHCLLMFYKYCIEWPLALPRRLTIPIVEEERWSRKLAISSCVLAPIFVVAVWAWDYADSVESIILAVGIGGGLGILLGLLAYFSTDNAQPPQQFLTLWLVGGFFMSIVWFYLVANELVQSLESLGNIFGISTSILALTVLAWGNSVGDLVADLALACSGPDGVQIAISGCYAGPLFNTVVGLGFSLVLGCLKSDPDPFFITDKDGSLFYIIGFLAIGLMWALLMLPLQDMRLGRSLGIGLIILYCSFFVVGVCYAMGWLT